MPNKYLNGCIHEPQLPIFYSPTTEMYVLIGINIIGCLISTISCFYMYKLRETPMVKASTPDLCFMQVRRWVKRFLYLSLKQSDLVKNGIFMHFKAIMTFFREFLAQK